MRRISRLMILLCLSAACPLLPPMCRAAASGVDSLWIAERGRRDGARDARATVTLAWSFGLGEMSTPPDSALAGKPTEYCAAYTASFIITARQEREGRPILFIVALDVIVLGLVLVIWNR